MRLIFTLRANGLTTITLNYQCELEHILHDWCLPSSIKPIVLNLVNEYKTKFEFCGKSMSDVFASLPFCKFYGIVLFAVKLIYGMVDGVEYVSCIFHSSVNCGVLFKHYIGT